MARVALSFLAEPGDAVLGALLRSLTPAEIVVAVSGAGEPQAAVPAASRGIPGLDRAFTRWRTRLGEIPTAARVAAWERGGLRLLCPDEPGWPTQLDDLGDARPAVLWLRGTVDLRFACLRSVSVVGSRAATAYGRHVAIELAAALAERGCTVISGGAYGIDASAHRGALAAGGRTVAVLAGGLSFGYPRGNQDLFETITEHGVMVSECPPDLAPNRPGFLVRNRVIAALSRGTVIVEAALRSGALNTARHARELNRPVLAVPGPLTSEQSAGCHQLIREFGATLVTCAGDVVEMIAPLEGTDDAAWLSAADSPADRPMPAVPAIPVESLDPVTASVLAVVPRRTGRGPAGIAMAAGVDLDTAIRCLGLLAAAGHVERCAQGWRQTRATSEP